MEAIHAVGVQCCGILSVCFVCHDKFVGPWVAECTRDLVNSFVLTSPPPSVYMAARCIRRSWLRRVPVAYGRSRYVLLRMSGFP